MWAERVSARVCFTGALPLLARCLCVPVMPGLPSLWGQGFQPGGRGGGLLGWGFRLCGCSRGSGFQGSRAAVALPLPPARALVPVPCPRPLCPGYPAALCPSPARPRSPPVSRLSCPPSPPPRSVGAPQRARCPQDGPPGRGSRRYGPLAPPQASPGSGAPRGTLVRAPWRLRRGQSLVLILVLGQC